MLKVSGGQSIERAASRLASASRGGLKRDLERATKRGTRNVERYFRANALAKMPKRGGFAHELAKARIRTSRINFGVRLTMESPHDMRKLERGQLRHPVYGVWRPGVPTQHVPPDVVRDAVMRADSEIKREIDAAVHRAVGQ